MTKPRIGRFSPPEDIDGSISDKDWAAIEEICGKAIPGETRAELADIRHRYLIWRYAECFAEKNSDAAAVLKRIKEAAAGLRFLAAFTGTSSDAAMSIGHPLRREYFNTPASVKPESLLAISDDNRYVQAIAEEYHEPLAVMLDNDLLRAVSQSVDTAIARVENLLDESGHFRSGDALASLDEHLRAWVKAQGLSDGVSKNETSNQPALYQRLIYFLDQLSPEPVRSFSGNAWSVADRIIKCRRPAEGVDK